MAQVSANFGMVSDYIYRGIFPVEFHREPSAGSRPSSTTVGFYIGTWGADVGQGIETDLYFGIGGSRGRSRVGASALRVTTTPTTGTTPTREINLGVSYGGLVGGSGCQRGIRAIRSIPSLRSATGSMVVPTSRSALSARTSKAVTVKLGLRLRLHGPRPVHGAVVGPAPMAALLARARTAATSP